MNRNEPGSTAVKKYPRVLIVHLVCLNEADQHSLSLRNWFADWPRENLAQIYSGAEVGEGRFCGFNYKLEAADRRWGSLFTRLKSSSLGVGSRPYRVQNSGQDAQPPIRRASLWKYRFSAALVNSGLWELLFPPLLSPQLLAWIYDFQPKVIYAQGYSLTFARLPLLLQQRLHLPLIFQTGDDWPRHLYQNSILSWIMQPLVQQAAQGLATNASRRFANGERMAEEYADRFGVPFEILMMCDRFERFEQAIPARTVDNTCISIVYSGGLAHRRWESIELLAKAAQELSNEGVQVKISVYAWTIPPEAASSLNRYPCVQVCPPPSDQDVPAIFKGADILFLPETFDAGEAAKIRLSISTKAHLYMMSQRPILVLGSPEAGVVDYARRAGWGYVVDQPNVTLLAQVIRKLTGDRELVGKLVETSRAVALQNHEVGTVRERFRKTLASLIPAQEN